MDDIDLINSRVVGQNDVELPEITVDDDLFIILWMTIYHMRVQKTFSVMQSQRRSFVNTYWTGHFQQSTQMSYHLITQSL